jgi:hypothetical protein
MILTRGLGPRSMIVTRGYGPQVIYVIGEAIKIFTREALQSIAKIAPTRVFTKARPVKDD